MGAAVGLLRRACACAWVVGGWVEWVGGWLIRRISK